MDVYLERNFKSSGREPRHLQNEIIVGYRANLQFVISATEFLPFLPSSAVGYFSASPKIKLPMFREFGYFDLSKWRDAVKGTILPLIGSKCCCDRFFKNFRIESW